MYEYLYLTKHHYPAVANYNFYLKMMFSPKVYVIFLSYYILSLSNEYEMM